MCLILVAHRVHTAYPLVLAANRDEAHDRPAAPAAFWREEPHIYGGRDLEKGGTWLGISRAGRIAAVTNFRNAHAARTASRSRGELVAAYLSGTTDAATYLRQVQARGEEYNGFILITGTLDALFWYSNRGPEAVRIPPGVHGLSNHLLDTPWPKIRRSKLALEALLDLPESGLTAGLFEILSDRSEAPDHELPDTGVGLQRERELSANFVCGERYGTRASTVLLVNAEGETHFIERSFGPRGIAVGEVSCRFRIDAVATVPQ